VIGDSKRESGCHRWKKKVRVERACTPIENGWVGQEVRQKKVAQQVKGHPNQKLRRGCHKTKAD